jgi:antitoxin (DNA-binding transcriptional repressor) of toxin-antitoxin stability system
MEEIGIFEAKTRFSEIAKNVNESGQPIRMTNRGEDMVDITHPLA